MTKSRPQGLATQTLTGRFTAVTRMIRSRDSLADTLARIVSEVFTPFLVIAVTLLLTSLSSAHLWPAIGYWLLATVFGVVLPMAFVVSQVIKGRFSSYHVPTRRQRIVPMCIAIVSVGLGEVLLWLTKAPQVLLAAYGSGLILLLVLTVTTKWRKVSLHASVMTGSLTGLSFIFGPVMVSGIPMLIAVCWARRRLRQHSVAELSLGMFFGLAITLAIFPQLR